MKHFAKMIFVLFLFYSKQFELDIYTKSDEF